MGKSDTESRADRIAELERLIRHHRDLYYNRQPEISDEEFDSLVDELGEVDPDNAVLGEVGAPPDGTGLPTKKHRIPMGSLDKVPEDRLDFWCDKVGGPFIVQEKLDGISLEIEYENGRMGDAITRGDGITGEVVTHNAVHFRNIARKLPSDFTGSIRAEVICRTSVFKEHLAGRGFANPRNTVSGTVRKKRGDRTLNRHFELQCYDVVGDGLDFETECEKVEFMRDTLGLDITVTFFDQDADGIREIFAEYAGDPEEGVAGKRLELDYEIDGLVVRADSIERQRELGEVQNRPRYAMAYKFVSQGRETTLRDVDWSVGLTGRVTPVARLEPVEVSGVTVSNATLHNVDYIKSLDLHIGDRVIVERKGDVIPQVVRVVSHENGKRPRRPRKCPECRARLELESKYLRCPNPECPKKAYGDVKRWIDELDIDAIGEKWITILIEGELVEDPADLYRLKAEQLLPLERMGKTLAEKMVRNIEESRKPPLDVFIAGLNVPEFSRQRAQMLVEAGHDTLEKVLALSPEEIAEVKGFGEILAERVHEGLHAREARIQKLLDAGVEIAPPTASAEASAEGPLAGKTFCFTGAVETVNPETDKHWTRKELEELVRANGGKPLPDVSKELDYLVMADPSSTSSKAKKAKKLGTEILSEEAFFALVGE